jgi:uncharacterized membrane protein
MTKEELEKRLEAWHRGAGFGVPLNEFLGWTLEQTSAYILRGEIPEE